MDTVASKLSQPIADDVHAIQHDQQLFEVCFMWNFSFTLLTLASVSCCFVREFTSLTAMQWSICMRLNWHCDNYLWQKTGLWILVQCRMWDSEVAASSLVGFSPSVLESAAFYQFKSKVKILWTLQLALRLLIYWTIRHVVRGEVVPIWVKNPKNAPKNEHWTFLEKYVFCL